jgi:hypothetical protein
MCCFFEERNQAKTITRLGATDFGICHTEKLLLINSYALAVGYKEDELPYNVTAPRKSEDDICEFMGFSYEPPSVLQEVSNPTDNTVTNYESDDGDEEVQVERDNEQVPQEYTQQSELLADLMGDDMDIEVFASEEEFELFKRNERSHDKRQLDELEDIAEKHDRANRLAIERELSRLLPTGNGKESTIEAFRRLTSQCQWIPFRAPDCATRPSDTDIAEALLYQEWMSDPDRSYNPTVKNGRRSFRQFEIDWNNEVTRRFKLWSSQGDQSDVTQLRYKSQLLLKQYFDKLAQDASLRAVLPTDDLDRNDLDNVLRTSRLSLTPAPPAEETTPPMYHGEGTAPLGAPTILNSEITVGSLRPAQEARAPYRVDLPAIPQVRPICSRRRFRSRKYCITCGFKRSNHVVCDEGVADKCTRDYCGKCRHRKALHGNSGFGLTCMKLTHPWQTSTVNDWYETVSYTCRQRLTLFSQILTMLYRIKRL